MSQELEPVDVEQTVKNLRDCATFMRDGAAVNTPIALERAADLIEALTCTPSTPTEEMIEADELERRAREIEGDSDNPLRVAAANELYAKAAAIKAMCAADTSTGVREATEKLEALRVMCESCSQPLYVKIIDEVLEALSIPSSTREA